MALYPPATKKLIPPGANDPAIIVCGAILHVAAGTSASLYPYFNGPSGGIESHFYVQEKGSTEQYRDTRYEADANLHGNSFRGKDGKLYGYVSMETWGLEPGEWNAAQLAEIKRLLLWLSDTHDFPLKKCATPTDPGVGYHVMFGAPGPWTPVAKSCPGPKRVKQFDNLLVPWFKTATAPKPPVTPPTGDVIDMATQEEVAQGVSDGMRDYLKDYHTPPMGTGWKYHQETLAAIKAQTDAINALVAVLTPKG